MFDADGNRVAGKAVREVCRAVQRVNDPTIIGVFVMAAAAFFSEDLMRGIVCRNQFFDVLLARQIGFGDEVDAAFMNDLEAACGKILNDCACLACGSNRKFQHLI